MNLTVYGIAVEALEGIRITAPSSIISNSDILQKQLRRIITAESRFLRNQFVFPQLKKRYSFSTTSGRSKYPFPEDFYGIITATGWDQTNSIPLGTSLSDEYVNDALYGIALSGSPFGFRPFGPDFNVLVTAGGQFNVVPTPTSTMTFSYEYISSNLFLPPNWTASEAGITTSKYRNANGIIYKCSAITTGTTGTTAPSHTSGSAVDGGVTWTVYTAPYEVFAADEDYSLFDDDIMIAGVRYRYQAVSGLDFEVDPETGRSKEYNRLLERTRSRMFGSLRGSFSRTCSSPRYRVPTGGWSI